MKEIERLMKIVSDLNDTLATELAGMRTEIVDLKTEIQNLKAQLLQEGQR